MVDTWTQPVTRGVSVARTYTTLCAGLTAFSTTTHAMLAALQRKLVKLRFDLYHNLTGGKKSLESNACFVKCFVLVYLVA